MEDINKKLNIDVSSDEESEIDIENKNENEIKKRNKDFDDLIIFNSCKDIFKNVINKEISCIICNVPCKKHCVWCSDENCIAHSIHNITLKQLIDEQKLKAYIRINVIYPKNVTFYLTGKFYTKENKKDSSFSKYFAYIEIFNYTMLSDMLKALEQKIFETKNLIVEKKVAYSYNEYLSLLRCDKLDNFTFIRSADKKYPIVYIDTNKSYNTISIKFNNKKYEFNLSHLFTIYHDLSDNIKSYIKDAILTVCISPVCIVIAKIDKKFTLKFKFNILLNMEEQFINTNRPDYEFNKPLSKDDIEEFINKLIEISNPIKDDNN